jgi:hypothetical protein
MRQGSSVGLAAALVIAMATGCGRYDSRLNDRLGSLRAGGGGAVDGRLFRSEMQIMDKNGGVTGLLIHLPKEFFTNDQPAFTSLATLPPAAQQLGIVDRNPGPVTQQGSLWAVTDFTAANGATRIVPGSHLWDEERQPHPDEVVAAEMPAGSAIIYAHNVIHGGGANQTDKPRTAVALNFSLGWLRQQENQFLTLPPEKAKELPEQLQRLIGYDFGAPFLGAVGGQNPHALLEEPGQDPGPRNDPELDRAYRERVHWLKAEAVPPPPGVLPTE